MSDDEQFMLVQILKESVQQGMTPSLTVISDSMSPMLCRGDKVGLRQLPPNHAEPGQIITFANPDDGQRLITHRVAGVFLENGKDKLATYGDRSLLLDLPVSFDDVIGLVVWRQRESNYIDLMSGLGAWLNKKLAIRAHKNLELATGLDIGKRTAIDSETVLLSNETCQRQRRKISKRLYFRLSYLWAYILTIASDFLSRGNYKT